MTTIFSTRVTAIGPEAAAMLAEAGMFILFGDGAPADLAEFCYSIDQHHLLDEIRVGDQFVVDGQSYPITAVGSVVAQNLEMLGHISINTDGATNPSLPGTLHIAADLAPTLEVGTKVEITR